MAAKKEKEATPEKTTTTTEGKTKQGQAIIITHKETGRAVKRADFIRDQYYKKGTTRSEIKKALATSFGHEVPYQIVFAATKTGERGKAESDPRLAVKAPKASEAATPKTAA